MSLDRLIASFLLRRDTSITEKGKTASMQRREGELVLLFQTDNPEVRKILGISKCCDGVFLYMRHRARPVLFFVELKGKDIATAADQIKSTMRAIQGIISQSVHRDFPLTSDMRAIVVKSGSSPQQQPKVQEAFLNETKVKLQFTRDKADLRDFL